MFKENEIKNKRKEIRKKEVHSKMNNLNMSNYDLSLENIVATLLQGTGVSNLIRLMLEMNGIKTFYSLVRHTKVDIIALRCNNSSNRSIALEACHILRLMNIIDYQKLL